MKAEVTATWEYDECADYSWIGEFSMNPGLYAIEHEPNNARTLDYFNPPSWCEDADDAQLYYDQMLAHERGDLSMMVCRVTVNCGGVEGCAVVGNVELASTEDPYAKELEAGLRREAFVDWRANVSTVRENFCR